MSYSIPSDLVDRLIEAIQVRTPLATEWMPAEELMRRIPGLNKSSLERLRATYPKGLHWKDGRGKGSLYHLSSVVHWWENDDLTHNKWLRENRG